jgi:Sulfotransferase family
MVTLTQPLPRDDRQTKAFRIDFLIAGVQKAGTSSLFASLAQHSEIGLSCCKELHYFDDDSVDWSCADYSGYHARFEPRAGGTVYGEATPIYLYWPSSLERIHNYNPAIKLIVLLRDPIQRAYAHWCAEVSKQRETLPFSEAVRAGRKRRSGSDEGQRWFSYVERGLYANQLLRAHALFPPENTLALDSHSMVTDPGSCMRRVTELLDLPPFGDDARILHLNQRRQTTELALPSFGDIQMLADLYATDLATLANLLDFKLDRWATWRLATGTANVEEVFAEITGPGFNPGHRTEPPAGRQTPGTGFG